MLPPWSTELIADYESGAANQFILHGNVNDRMLVAPAGKAARLGNLEDFLEEVLLPGFDVVVSYDLGNGLRIEKGGEIYTKWPSHERHGFPRKPREALDAITHFLRYCANVRRVKASESAKVAVILKAAHLTIPNAAGALNYELNAMALVVRAWANDSLIADHPAATFLLSENINDLHPLVAANPRAAHIRVALPSPHDLRAYFEFAAPSHPMALDEFKSDLARPSEYLVGATLSAVDALLKEKEYRKEPLRDADLSGLKRELVERDCQGLIEFIEPDRTLADIYGQDAIKEWLRQDIALWRQNDLAAMPMGYLLCGPVGTGKTYMVECLAGEAAVPVVKFKNFRDKWVGSTEGNLEKIFRLLEALGRCIVFIDEADQALGSRNAGGNDSGVSGRVYSMMAKQMSNTRNRGRILWILASSRPDLIEVDLKRPGRVDVKIPLFPTTTKEEGFFLIRALCKKAKVEVPKDALTRLIGKIPDLVTPGAAESLGIKVYRLVKTKGLDPETALAEALDGYQNPVPKEVLDFQIDLAVKEASDMSFVPETFR